MSEVWLASSRQPAIGEWVPLEGMFLYETIEGAWQWARARALEYVVRVEGVDAKAMSWVGSRHSRGLVAEVSAIHRPTPIKRKPYRDWVREDVEPSQPSAVAAAPAFKFQRGPRITTSED